MGSLWLDVRYALRMMVKTPGLTCVLAITLALGIGASTTIFSVVNSVVLRPLPYEKPEQLVRVYTEFVGRNMTLHRFWVSGPEYIEFAEACRTCQSTGTWLRGTASLSGGDRPVRVQAGYVTHTLLPLLGVKPMIGRYIDPSEDKPGADPSVVILGYDLWKRAYGGDPTVVGRKITLDAMPVTIIGVMPKGFDFLDNLEAWAPMNMDFPKQNRGGHNFNVVARLRDGVTIDQFNSELNALLEAWGKEFRPGSPSQPGRHALGPARTLITNGGTHTMIAAPFHQDLVGGLSTTLWLLQGAVLFVLLISIVNVANLLLARSETRTREVAVRHALGATRTRLMRQFVTESLILGLLGGALGVFVAVWAVDGVTALIPKSAPRASEITLDTMAVMFAVGCSVIAALLFGIAPILHARKTDIHGALKDGSPRMTGSPARLRVRRALVIGEIALAVVLVIGCTVMVRSFLRLQSVDLGFDPDHVLSFEIELPEKTYPGTTGDQFWQRLQDRLKAIPGVSDVGVVDGIPPSRPINANDIGFVGKTPKPEGPQWNVDYWQVFSPGSIGAMRGRIVKGRGIQESDTVDAPTVAVVNEAFVKKFYPNENPLGQRVIVFGDMQAPQQTIVGVYADMKNAGVDNPAGSEIALPIAQFSKLGWKKPQSVRSTGLVVRTPGDALELVPAVHRAVAEIDPSLPVSKLRTLNDLMWEAVARPRFLTFLLSSFAAIALLLAAVGIYGVMAHTVAQRTHEIGLRVALGAQPAQVRAMVLRQAGILVAAGVAIGLGAAVALQVLLDKSLRGLFYGSELSQPVLLGMVAVAVGATALLATWLPARRATKIEPMTALRSE
jgi:putative ABC transport system permease protein